MTMSAAVTRVRADVLREIVGPGPAWLVRPTSPPSMAVEVANVVLAIGAPHLLLHRIDLVCLDMRDGRLCGVVVIHGTPAACPCSPAPYRDLLPIAKVQVKPLAHAIAASDIEEIRP